MTDREQVIAELTFMKRYVFEGSADYKTLDKAIVLLKEQPEIVRCKDCKHYKDGPGMCALYHAHGCAETWFCADGERKIEDA